MGAFFCLDFSNSTAKGVKGLMTHSAGGGDRALMLPLLALTETSRSAEVVDEASRRLADVLTAALISDGLVCSGENDGRT